MPATDNPLVITTSFPVRYAETDAMGVVHHAAYLVYFEEGRSHYMRAIGSDYALLEADGYQLPVTEVGLRYAGSLRYGQQVEIQTWIEADRSRRLDFAYQVCLPRSDTVLVRGFTRHVWTDRQGRVSSRPARWQALIPGTVV
ncbi:MAG: thioesterase family protein [Pseudohongiellaceae bacterium]